MNDEMARERVKQGLAIRRELKSEIKVEGNPVRQDQLRIHLMELESTILGYKKITRAYKREHKRRRERAETNGMKRFVHLGEWFRV